MKLILVNPLEIAIQKQSLFNYKTFYKNLFVMTIIAIKKLS